MIPPGSPGDEVVVTGWGLSETHPGGYTERQRVPPARVARAPPEGLSAAQAMAIGTAGLTAMLCVMALEDARPHAPTDDGEVLVTGAAGGVGSVAVAILAHLGYRVTASTGPARDPRPSALARGHVVRRPLPSCPPSARGRWTRSAGRRPSTPWAAPPWPRCCARPATGVRSPPAGWRAATTCRPRSCRSSSATSPCSGSTPCSARPTIRAEAWRRLATDLPTDRLDALTTVEPLSRAPELAETILAGQVRGRVVFDTPPDPAGPDAGAMSWGLR